MSNYSFNVMPTIGISRSRFERKSQHKTSFNLGDIVPIYCDEVLPGDTRSLDLAALVRMSTPIAPIMDNIYLDLYAFFVPNRLVWDHWKEFCGENNESAGIPSQEYSVPGLNLSDNGLDNNGLLRYLGIPSRIQYAISPDEGGDFFVSALQARGYYTVFNYWFRNQNIIAPIPVNTSDNEGVIIDFGANDQTLPLCKASKLPDYFTKALPYAQKGDAVKIPMGNFAPVITTTAPSLLGGKLLLGNSSATYYVSENDGSLETGGNPSSSDIIKSNLGVNVSAIAGTIDQLRYAFQLQKLLWKDAAYGSRYWELLASHFGVTSPDASLQIPEYLGGKRMNINIDQVVSTAGYDSDSSTTVGATGANSVSAFKGSIFTKSFTEHGTLFIMAVARHDQTYGQGINRMFTRRNRFDFYWPVFANLGAQDIKVKEIYLPTTTTEGGSTIVDEVEAEKVFGYQEAWAEYRFKPSIVTGVLDPSLSGSLDFWTLANNFSQKPTLGQTFIEQDRAALARALVTGENGPDFIADFYFRDIAVRPMPTFSLPGYADHH